MSARPEDSLELCANGHGECFSCASRLLPMRPALDEKVRTAAMVRLAGLAGAEGWLVRARLCGRKAHCERDVPTRSGAAEKLTVVRGVVSRPWSTSGGDRLETSDRPTDRLWAREPSAP